MFFPKDCSQHIGAAHHPRRSALLKDASSEFLDFFPLSLHSGCWIIKDKAAKGFRDPSPREPGPPTNLLISFDIRELPSVNFWVGLSGIKLCLSPGDLPSPLH